MVKFEVDLESRYNVVGREAKGTSNIFMLRKFNSHGSEYNVTNSMMDNHLECSCLQFESDGIPCRHIFAIEFGPTTCTPNTHQEKIHNQGKRGGF